MALKTLFITAVTASHTSAKDSLGDIRHEDGKRYKYVKFVVATVEPGDVVKYANLAGYDASEVQPLATLALAVAGVAMAAQAINDFGWIQIGGRSGPLLVNITDTPVLGDSVASSATTKAFKEHAGETAVYGTIVDLTASSSGPPIVGNVVLLNIPD